MDLKRAKGVLFIKWILIAEKENGLMFSKEP